MEDLAHFKLRLAETIAWCRPCASAEQESPSPRAER
jgi:hypothetical protein